MTSAALDQHPRGVARVDPHRDPLPTPARLRRRPCGQGAYREVRRCVTDRVTGAVSVGRGAPPPWPCPTHCSGAELVVAQVAEVVDRRGRRGRRATPARRTVALDRRDAGGGEHRSGLAVRAPDDLSGVARCSPASSANSARSSPRDPVAAARPALDRVACSARARVAASARPHASRIAPPDRSTQPGSSRSTPARMAAPDSASSRRWPRRLALGGGVIPR